MTEREKFLNDLYPITYMSWVNRKIKKDPSYSIMINKEPEGSQMRQDRLKQYCSDIYYLHKQVRQHKYTTHSRRTNAIKTLVSMKNALQEHIDEYEKCSTAIYMAEQTLNMLEEQGWLVRDDKKKSRTH